MHVTVRAVQTLQALKYAEHTRELAREKTLLRERITCKSSCAIMTRNGLEQILGLG